MHGKVLVFGGENLPKGTHTFYESAKGGEHRVEVGQEVPYDEVVNAEHFIKNKLAAVKTTDEVEVG